MSNDYDYFFEKPFADTGDKILVPVDTQPDGSVSFDTGWGFDYQRDPDPLVDPLTKPVPRDQTNWLMNVITGVLGQLQSTGGAPLWSAVRATMPGTGGGNGYPKDARVYWTGTVWTSLLPNNGAVPGAVGSENWWTENSALDATLRAMAALAPTTNQMIYFSGTDQAAVTALTSFGRNLIGAANSGDGLTVLGVLTGFSMTANSLNLPNIFGDPTNPSHGGFKLRWGEQLVGGNSSFPTGNIFPNRCLGGIVCRASTASPSTRDTPSARIIVAGRGATLYNPDNNSDELAYFMWGD
jgi:hypothetical protein